MPTPDFAPLPHVPSPEGPPDRPSISMAELRVAVLRAADGRMPLDALTTWLAIPLSVDPTQPLRLGHRPIDLLVMAMGTRREDLLRTLLGAPAFCPTETSAVRRAMQNGPEGGRRIALHGHDLFNGGIDTAAAFPGEPGAAWVNARVEVAKLGDVPVNRTTPNLFQWRRADGSVVQLDQDDPLRQVPPEVLATHTVQQQRDARALGGQGYPDAYRHTGSTNLLGLAVMMGWVEGLQVLLDHGVDPYAHVGPRQLRASPVVLAAVHGETACMVALMQHPSFRPQARYGYTETETTRRRSTPDDRGTPWSERTEFGGFDLTFLLEDQRMAHDPEIRAALLPRLTRGVVRLLTTGRSGLSVTAHQTLERLVLEQALRDVSEGPEPIVERPRARL